MSQVAEEEGKGQGARDAGGGELTEALPATAQPCSLTFHPPTHLLVARHEATLGGSPQTCLI